MSEKELTPSGAPEAPESKPDREAAKYRRQLRDTEAKVSALSSRLEAMQRREVERLAAADLSTPADLWLAGPTLAQLLTDDGADVDAEKVKAATEQVLADRPGWKRPDPPPSFDGGVRRSAPTTAGWQDVLRGRTRP